MENKLKQFLDDAFRPYGNFPSRKDVEQELLANLTEKYQDLKVQGKTDDEAYQAIVESFGDVSEIMDQVHVAAEPEQAEDKSIRKTLKETFKLARRSTSKFTATELKQSDLSDTNLVGADFSFSSLSKSNFDNADLTDAKFRAAELREATFKGANLAGVLFAGSDMQAACFDGANVSGAAFKASSLKDATFKDATLDATSFNYSDLQNVSFDNLTLRGTKFDRASLKNTSFKNTTLIDVSFHHSDVKHTIFDGTVMDKVTYALLKGAKAKLDNVTIQ